MDSVSTLLVERNIAQLRDVEEADARRVLYGGDLVTNLLELVAVDEAALTLALADSHELEAAPVGELPRADEQTLRLVPADVALRHNLYPLAQTDDVLNLAVSERLKGEEEQELSFALGLKLVQHATTVARVRQALRRDYGLPIDRRTERLLAKLDGLPDPAPSVSPSPLSDAPRISSFPKPPSIPPLGSGRAEASGAAITPTAREVPHKTTMQGIPAASASLPKQTTAGMPAVGSGSAGGAQASNPNGAPLAAQTDASNGTAPLRTTSRSRRKRHRGPYTPAQAERDLREAHSRDDVVTVFFDFVSQYFEYTALFSIHGDMATGHDAHGPGADHEEIRNIGVPLDLPSSLGEARATLQFTVALLHQDGLDRTFANDLKRPARHRVFFLPIALRGRCVLVLYGDEDNRDVELSEIGDVLAMAPLMVSALEHVILQRKLQQKRQAAKARSDQSAQPAAAEAQAPAAQPERAPAAQPSAEPPPSDKAEPPPKPVASEPPAATEAKPTEDSATQQAASRIPAKPQRVIVIEEAGKGSAESAPISVTQIQSQEGDSAANGAVRREVRVSLDAFGEDDDWDIPDDPMPAQIHSRQAPPDVSTPDDGWGEPGDETVSSVIVQDKAQAQELLHRLLNGDHSAEEPLLGLGISALTMVIGQFPGPINEPPEGHSKPELASAYGPVLHFISRMGTVAAPFVVVRTNDGDAHVRRWATWLLGEVAPANAVPAVARRLNDEDADVRTAALDASRQLLAKDATRAALGAALRDLLASPNTDEDDRLVYLEAIVELRVVQVIPVLIQALENSDATAQSVEWALSILTGQAFGRDIGRWQEWWEARGKDHRVEWLIDALGHSDIDMRRAASQELKVVTKRYFGYYEDLPTAERTRAQKRYREWWESEGRALHT